MRDYDSNGKLIPGVKPTITVYGNGHDMLQDLNKNIITDPAGFANLKAYIRNLRDSR